MQPTPTDPIAQIEGFLRADPDNATLRAEAFDVCLRHGLLGQAEAHLHWGLAQAEDVPEWGLRHAHWLMAQRNWSEAAALLDSLRQDPRSPHELHVTATVDLAQVSLRSGAAARGVELMRTLMAALGDGPLPDSAQTLWLRLLHHQGQVADAMQWASAAWRAQRLGPLAAGVASLVALDYGDLQASRIWADHALREPGAHMEAWVALASVALAEQDQTAARNWLSRALAHNAADGRARSALAFVELQAGDLPAARREFELAVVQLADHIGTWHGLGWTCLLQGELAAARVAFESSLALDRNFAESHGGLAVVQVRETQTNAAKESIERALRLDRHCLSAHYALALLEGRADDGEALGALARRLLVTKARRSRP